ncbi:hypothetical protein HRbin32_01052 [bacterium HR32]|nr:hypothetical protein HRbin32_01052 [bacterium HR32]
MSTAAVVLAVAASVAGAAVGAAHLIVPGRAVGPIVLGMRMVQVFQYLGPPEGREHARASGKFFWPARGVTVRVGRDGRVDAVFVESPEYRTAQGIGVGSHRDEVVAAFGPAFQAQEDRNTLILAYPRLGISFAIHKGRGDRVQLVMVYPPG